MQNMDRKMDEIKSKFFDLIHLPVNSKIPIVGGFSAQETIINESSEAVNKNTTKEVERPSDQEILEAIDIKYLGTDNDFDSGRYELEKFVTMDMKKIEADLNQLKQQQLVVSNHVLQMILEKQLSCQEEFTRITQIQNQVDDILNNVRYSRDKLAIATKQFTTASLGILANYRKRTLVQQLLCYLSTIKTLHKTESKLRELFNSGDFPGAIVLLLECQNVASTYKHFACVAALSVKLKETLEMTEEKLDNTLAQMCSGFDENVYEKLQSAYSLLGKTQVAMDQFPMHFTSAVQNTAYNIVKSYMHEGYNNSEMQYSEICQEIKEENFIPCLIALCKSLWIIVLSYNQVVSWHQKYSTKTKDTDFESNLNEEQIKKKLKKGYTRLWNDVQTRVSLLVMAADLSVYKFDDFLQVLGILLRLTQIGEEFCESESEKVALSVKAKSSHYFNSYHSARLDDLKVFLENESWSPCPVRSDFTSLHLQEFRGIRLSEPAEDIPRSDSSMDGSSVGANFFNRFSNPSLGTPFDSSFQVDSKEENILAKIQDLADFSEDSEEEEEISAQIKIKKTKNSSNGPLLTNTTLTVLRSCGKYLQMSRLLKSISSDVIVALVQLFEYYLYTVHSFFSSNIPDTFCGNPSSLKLQSVINRIKESLIKSEDLDENITKISEAQISSIVDVSSSSTLYALSERIVAVESLAFLAKEYNSIKTYVEKLVSPQSSSSIYLSQFYSQTVSVADEVRKPVYSCVAWRAIDIKQTLTMMSKVDWEVKELLSQHSKYVDFLLEDIKLFNNRINEIKSNFTVPNIALKNLWDSLILLLCNVLVEGFASTKKCSNEGRCLMQLDFRELITKMDKLYKIRPTPYEEFVNSYIKAYYLTEDNLELWIKEHKEYTSKQLVALVSCTCQSSKRSRQKLMQLIEELEIKK